MHIEQLSRITGVPVSTIRHYEQADLLPATGVVGGNTNYSEAHIHAIKLIKMAQDIGLSLREIVTVLAAQDDEDSSMRLNRAMVLLSRKRSSLLHDADIDDAESIAAFERELTTLFH
ncbi:MAG: MerR family transcriptional regulator [Agarilytica sp.]